ncbi:MAG: acyltransferase family protein [Sedimentisphaerales bacterium]|jgi:peptidoglycan/LPS O-acetylase OafA/YrhL
MQKRDFADKHERRRDIDILRGLAMLTVFLFHCGRFFNEEGWHVKNAQVSHSATVVMLIVAQWMMPLFFVLSGISAYYALRYQKPGQYILARIKRLAVPFIFGTFVVIAPLEIYLERLSEGQFKGSFIEFYPHYFDGWYGFGGNFAWMGVHLWYLEMLFIFSLLTLPFFIDIAREPVRIFFSRIARSSGGLWVIVVPSIAIFAIEWLVQTDTLQHSILGPRGFGGWPLLQYLLFFVLGYIAACDSAFKEAFEKLTVVALAIGISIGIVGYSLTVRGYAGDDVLSAALRSLNAWCWLVAILGLGSRYLNFENRATRYTNETVLPFYILHQTVMLVIGFYVVRLNIPMAAKFLIIAAISFAVIIAICDIAIKRINLLRFLFGMKLKKNKM